MKKSNKDRRTFDPNTSREAWQLYVDAHWISEEYRVGNQGKRNPPMFYSEWLRSQGYETLAEIASKQVTCGPRFPQAKPQDQGTEHERGPRPWRMEIVGPPSPPDWFLTMRREQDAVQVSPPDVPAGGRLFD